MYEVLKSFSSVKVVCKCCGSVINMYGVLKNWRSVIVICEYNGSVSRCGWSFEKYVEVL